MPRHDKLFTGQQRETTNGIYHYKARMYNTDVGRFPQADTRCLDRLPQQRGHMEPAGC
jgi:RHS repeat-associated protein